MKMAHLTQQVRGLHTRTQRTYTHTIKALVNNSLKSTEHESTKIILLTTGLRNYNKENQSLIS